MPSIIHTFDTVFAKDRKTWRKWLQKHHTSIPGIWLVYYKKDSGQPTVSYAEAVEEALCFGWIDSTTNTIDQFSYRQLFMPRKPKSNWSKINKERITRMIAEGLMTPAGMEKIEAAKKDGTWTKLDDAEDLIIPPDLQKALNANKTAKKNFDTFSKTNKKHVLFWLSGTKRPEKRSQIIEEVIAAAAENKVHERFATTRKK